MGSGLEKQRLRSMCKSIVQFSWYQSCAVNVDANCAHSNCVEEVEQRWKCRILDECNVPESKHLGGDLVQCIHCAVRDREMVDFVGPIVAKHIGESGNGRIV